MKATIRKTETFSFEIGHTTHIGFEKIETWKGMTCYKNSVGEIIAAGLPSDSPVAWVFEMIGDKPTDEDQEVVIISASPCFIGGKG